MLKEIIGSVNIKVILEIIFKTLLTNNAINPITIAIPIDIIPPSIKVFIKSLSKHTSLFICTTY